MRTDHRRCPRRAHGTHDGTPLLPSPPLPPTDTSWLRTANLRSGSLLVPDHQRMISDDQGLVSDDQGLVFDDQGLVADDQ